MSSTNPPPEERLIDVLCQIVALRDRLSRDVLLRRLPARPVASMRRSDTLYTDICAIVEQASQWGWIKEQEQSALHIVIDNACQFVAGTSQEQELLALKQQLENGGSTTALPQSGESEGTHKPSPLNKLTGQQYQQLTEALQDAFPSQLKLAQLVRFGLNKHLDTIAHGGNLEEVVFKLVEAAEAEGWTDKLINAACKQNPGNPKLQVYAYENGYLTEGNE